MNVFKRAYISTRRRQGKVVILFVVVFLLATLTAGGISVRQAIINTAQNLRSQLPAIATLRQDEDAIEQALQSTGSWPVVEGLHASMIRDIGALPYVRGFDYTARGHHFFSDDIVRVFHPELFLLLDPPVGDPRDSFSFSVQQGFDFEQFILKGVHNPYVMDIEAGLVELVAGRVFTESEVAEGNHVAIVSQDFLDANGLLLGDILSLDYRIYDTLGGGEFIDLFAEDNLLSLTIFSLEIIGVFEHTFPTSENLVSRDIFNHIEILNRIYVPNGLIESTVDLYIEAFIDTAPDVLTEILGADNLEDIIQYENIIFLLDDPTNLVVFQDAATELLPDFWTVSDLSNAYAEIASSMEMLEVIANWLIVGATVSTLIVLILLILLFLRDRKQEIGIYLALGEYKVRIMSQMMTELLLISIISITCSLFIGNLLGNAVSTTMIRNDLIRQSSEERTIHIEANTPEAMGFRHEMTHEEMLAAYDVSLDGRTVIIFYSIALGTIIISLMIPITYIMKLNPKDILLKGSIG